MMRWWAPLLGGLALAAGPAAAPEPAPPLVALAADDEGERFEVALALLERGDAGLDTALEGAIEHEPFRSSPRARAAARFVLARRSGTLPSAPPPERPNVLLVSIDTLRADHLGCYGYGRPTSPVLDALAARGARFTRAASTSSWTLPAHMSMFTALYPAFHKLERGGQLGTSRLDDREPTLAELLRARGYATAGLVAHPFLSGAWGFDRGFGLYRRYQTRAGAQSERARTWLEWHAFHASEGLAPAPFFLFLHYIDPHETYDPPAPHAARFTAGYTGPLHPTDHLVTMFRDRPFERPEDRAYALGLYDGEIRYVDEGVGRVLARLRELGLERHTIVVVTSDHGEEFHEHGSMGHKHTLYQEQLHVPLLLAWPGRVAAGQHRDVLVSLVDLAPTLLDLVGAPGLAGAQGRSLVPELAFEGAAPAAGAAPPRVVFAELGPLGHEWEGPVHLKSAQSGAHKLIVGYDPAGQVRSRELYALEDDPAEQRDLYAARSGERAVRELEARLAAFANAGREYRPGAAEQNAFEVDPETLERLRSLGYVD